MNPQKEERGKIKSNPSTVFKFFSKPEFAGSASQTISKISKAFLGVNALIIIAIFILIFVIIFVFQIMETFRINNIFHY